MPQKDPTLRRAFLAGIILNGFFVAAEAVAGFLTHSLALLTDAGHNLGDVAGLGLAMLAFRLSEMQPNETFTYGYKKTTILVALVNACILFIACGIIGYSAVLRFFHAYSVPGNTIALIAGAGIVVNTITALLFRKRQGRDLNVRGAYLHMAADALVSGGVVAAGIVISFTSWNWLDPAVSLVIIAVILVSSWRLFSESFRLSLDAVPHDIDVGSIRDSVMQMEGVLDMHHIHIWAMSTRENALTAHILVPDKTGMPEIESLKSEIKRQLEKVHIQHATLEFENTSAVCDDTECAEDAI